MSGLPSRSLLKAIREPSGDHAAYMLELGSSMSGTGTPRSRGPRGTRETPPPPAGGAGGGGVHVGAGLVNERHRHSAVEAHQRDLIAAAHAGGEGQLGAVPGPTDGLVGGAVLGDRGEEWGC